MLQVQLPAGVKIIIIIIRSTYEVDGALSCYWSKVVIWKVGDVVYGLIFLCVVVAFHAFHSDVFELVSARLKRISYYAFRLVFNRVFNINLLVLDFSFDFIHTRFDLFTSILAIMFH